MANERDEQPPHHPDGPRPSGALPKLTPAQGAVPHGEPPAAPSQPAAAQEPAPGQDKPAAEAPPADEAKPTSPDESAPAGEAAEKAPEIAGALESGGEDPMHGSESPHPLPSSETEAAHHGGEDPSHSDDSSHHDDQHHDEHYDHGGHTSEEEDEYHRHHNDRYHEEHGTTGEVDPLYAPEPGEEGGGPIKSFLEHLEDFRWVIIRSASAIMIGMTICLLGANWIVAILKHPLEKAARLYPDKRQHISLMFGTKEVANFKVETNHVPPWFTLTNKFVEFEFVPVRFGTNWVMTLGVRQVSEEIPYEKAKPIIYQNPAAPFMNALHIAFFGGLLLSAPFVLYFMAQFLLPALKERERKYLMKALVPAAILFISGVCLCYFLILPLALRAAEQYSTWMGVDMPFWVAEDYFSFCIKFMLGMGLGFEMPVILLALVKIGLLDYDKLRRGRRYMILVNLILGALLTTPEVLTQVAMFVPLQLLYEVSIWIAWYWERQERKKREAEEAANAGKKE